jgi:hypothetical protein
MLLDENRGLTFLRMATDVVASGEAEHHLSSPEELELIVDDFSVYPVGGDSYLRNYVFYGIRHDQIKKLLRTPNVRRALKQRFGKELHQFIEVFGNSEFVRGIVQAVLEEKTPQS